MKQMMLAGMLALLLTAAATADDVVLRSGQVLRGDIVAYDQEGVIIRMGGPDRTTGIDYRVAGYAIDRILLQQVYDPALTTVAPQQTWAAGWAASEPYAYAGLAGVGELRRQLEVTGAVVNLRNGPGLRYAVIDRVAKGDFLTAIAAQDNWFRILRGDGTTAWISGDLVRPLNVEQGVLMGSVGYGTAVTAPVTYMPVAPAPAPDMNYWRQQYLEGLVQGVGAVPAR